MKIILEDETYHLIGQFVFWFSQLEMSLRIALAESLQLPQELFDPVTSSYDFRTLCAVTEAACIHGATDDATRTAIRDLLSQAKSMNDIRVRVVHCFWMPADDGGLNALHMSRQNLKVSEIFADRKQLSNSVRECQRVAQDAMFFPGGGLITSIDRKAESPSNPEEI